MIKKVDGIVLKLKWKINSGVFKTGQKIPSENALAIKFDCSRLTARKALQILKTEGFIISRQGIGYYVTLGKKKLVYKPRHGSDKLKHQFQVSTLMVDESIIKNFVSFFPISRNYINDFGFSFFKKTFNDEGTAFTVLRSFINTTMIKEFEVDEMKDSLSAFFSKKNIVVKERKEMVLVSKPPIEICNKLNISKNSLVVVSYAIMFDNKKEPVEFSIRYTIPEEYSQIQEKKY